MKTFAALFVLMLLVGCADDTTPSAETATASPAQPEPAPDNMPSTTQQPAQPTADPAPAAAVAGTTATATGTVHSIDATAGTITIAHDPVAALDWPAMTMGFAATPEQVASVQVGQKVEFEFVAQGMNATLSRITPTS